MSIFWHVILFLIVALFMKLKVTAIFSPRSMNLIGFLFQYFVYLWIKNNFLSQIKSKLRPEHFYFKQHNSLQWKLDRDWNTKIILPWSLSMCFTHNRFFSLSLFSKNCFHLLVFFLLYLLVFCQIEHYVNKV